MAGAPIKDGVVLIREGKIDRVGPASSVSIPDGFRDAYREGRDPWSHRCSSPW